MCATNAVNPVAVLDEFLASSLAVGSTYTADTLTRAKDSATRLLTLTQELAKLDVNPMLLNTAQAVALVTQARVLVAGFNLGERRGQG